MLSIPSRTRMPRRYGTNRHHRPLSNRLAELTEIFPPPGQARTARSLVLLRLQSIVILSMYSRFDFFSETLCKVNAFFRHGQILMRFLTNFLFQPRSGRPKAASAGLSSEKRVQSYNLSAKQPNILSTFFKENHGKTTSNNANS